MNKKILVLLSLLVAVTVVFSACGNKKDSNSSNTADVSTADVSTPDAPADDTAANGSVSAQIDTLNADFDSLIKKVQGYIDNPDTYTADEATAYAEEYYSIATRFADITANMSEEEETEVWKSVNEKNAELLTIIGQLPQE
jgi:hypothetical protein